MAVGRRGQAPPDGGGRAALGHRPAAGDDGRDGDPGSTGEPMTPRGPGCRATGSTDSGGRRGGTQWLPQPATRGCGAAGGDDSDRNPTPADVGTALREARDALGVTPGGGPRPHRRVALPARGARGGRALAFPTGARLVVAVRRRTATWSSSTRTDSPAVPKQWGRHRSLGPREVAPSGVERDHECPRASTCAGYAGPRTGHLSRYPGDGTHLRAFTQTDEVPGVRGLEPLRDSTATARSPAPVALPAVPGRVRGASGSHGSLRAACGSPPRLLAVGSPAWPSQHYHPKLLADIHLVHHGHTPEPVHAGVAGLPPRRTPGPPPVVSLADTGVGQRHGVGAGVATTPWWWRRGHPAGPWCTDPRASRPSSTATLAGGPGQRLQPRQRPVDGAPSSASLVTVQVKVNGQDRPGVALQTHVGPLHPQLRLTTRAGPASAAPARLRPGGCGGPRRPAAARGSRARRERARGRRTGARPRSRRADRWRRATHHDASRAMPLGSVK